MTTTEMLKMIAMVAPNLHAFRAVQLASRRFQLSLAESYWTRLYFRTSVRMDTPTSREHYYILPNQQIDGKRTHDYKTNGGIGYSHYLNGVKQSGYVHMDSHLMTCRRYVNGTMYVSNTYYRTNGTPSERRDYMDRELHGTCMMWAPNGTLLNRFEYVHNKCVASTKYQI